MSTERALRELARKVDRQGRAIDRLRAQERALANARELGGIRRDGPAAGSWTHGSTAWTDFGGAGWLEQGFTKRLDGTHLLVPFDISCYHDSGTNTVWEIGLELAGAGEVGGGWKFGINPSVTRRSVSGWLLVAVAAPGAGAFTLTLRIRRVGSGATITTDSQERSGYRVLEVPSDLDWS